MCVFRMLSKAQLLGLAAAFFVGGCLAAFIPNNGVCTGVAFLCGAIYLLLFLIRYSKDHAAPPLQIEPTLSEPDDELDDDGTAARPTSPDLFIDEF